MLFQIGQPRALLVGLIELSDYVVEHAIGPAIPATLDAALVRLVGLIEKNASVGITLAREFLFRPAQEPLRLLAGRPERRIGTHVGKGERIVIGVRAAYLGARRGRFDDRGGGLFFLIVEGPIGEKLGG